MNATLDDIEKLISGLDRGDRIKLGHRLSQVPVGSAITAQSDDPTWQAFLRVQERLAALPGPSLTDELIASRR